MKYLLPLLFCALVVRSQDTGPFDLVVYPTIADMLARASTKAPNKWVRVLGYNVAGDGGGGDFQASTGITGVDGGTRFQSTLTPGDSWTRMVDGDSLRAEWFGAVGDGVTSDTAALRSLFTSLATRGGAAQLGPSKTYNVSSVTNSYPFYDFTNSVGVTINGQGSTFDIGGGTNYGTFLQFSGGTNITLRNLNFNTSRTNLANDLGPEWVSFRLGVVNTRLEQINIHGGNYGFVFRGILYGGAGTDDNRCRGIVIDGYTTKDVYYPIATQGAGDDLVATGCYFTNTVRAYYNANAKNHRVTIHSAMGGNFSDVLFGIYCVTNVYSAIEDVEVNYFTDGPTPGPPSSSALVQMNFVGFSALGSMGPGILRNIKVHLNVNLPATKQINGLVGIRKYDASATVSRSLEIDPLVNPDVLPRGHKIENVEISGTAQWGANAMLDIPINLCANPNDNWTGDFVQNVSLKNLIMPNPSPYAQSILADGRGFVTNQPALLVENVYGLGTLAVLNNFSGFQPRVVDSFLNGQSGLTTSSNLNITGTTYTSRGIFSSSGAGGFYASGSRLWASSSLTPLTGDALAMYNDGANSIFDSTLFNGTARPFAWKFAGSSNLMTFQADRSLRINAGALWLNSSTTPSTGDALKISHDGVNSIFDSTYYNGSAKPFVWKFAGGTLQMSLSPAGILQLPSVPSKILATDATGLIGGVIVGSGLSYDGPTKTLTATSPGGIVGPLSGDITTVGAAGTVTTLKNTGPGAGTYNSGQTTVDAQGRVTGFTPLTRYVTLAISDPMSAITVGKSNYFTLPAALTIKSINGRLLTGGSTASTLVLRNGGGAALATASMTTTGSTSTNALVSSLNISVPADNVLIGEVTAAGTGAKGAQIVITYTIP